MTTPLSRRERRRLGKTFASFARDTKKAEAGLSAMMRQVRATGYQWLAIVEELERENPEAARLSAGVKESCEIIIGRSADTELALGDTLAARSS